MKKLVFTYSFSIVFLLVVLALAMLLVRPIMRTIGAKLETIQNDYVALLEDTVGLTVSYDSLSPSILSAIRMENIQISDVENDSSLIAIGSVKLRWNILRLFGDNPENALGELVIDGFTADYDYLQNSEIIEKVVRAFQSTANGDALQVEAVEMQIESEEDLQRLIQTILSPVFALPIDVQFKNTELTYNGNAFFAQINFSTIEIYDQDTTEYLNLIVDGVVKLTSKDAFEDFGELSTRISLKGRVSETLENSFAQLSLSSFQESDYVIPRLDFHTFYSNNTLHAVAMQNVLPFSIEFLYNALEEQAKLTFNAENFQIFDLVSYEGQNELLRNFRGTSISGKYDFSYNRKTLETDYSATGSMTLPPLLTGEEIVLSYGINGDTDTLRISYFDALSNTISAGYTGSVNLSTFIPSGLLDIRSFSAPSGNTLSSEIYFDSLENELIIFAPQIMLGEKALTALQLEIERIGNEIDFSFEVSDYSRSETSEPGVLSANGNYDFDTNQFFQLEVLSDGMFLSSINELLLWYLPKEEAQTFALLNSPLEPYIFSFNAFFSTDFNSYSYSVPYVIVANTELDDEFLLFSANGNESLFQVPNLDMLVAGQSIQLEASGDLGDGKSEIFFNSSLFFNSIPYTFSGAFMPTEYLAISGDYDLNVAVNFYENVRFSAIGQVQALPISISNTLLSLSFDTSVTHESIGDWFVDVKNFNIENITSTNILRPNFTVIGNVTPNGAFFNQVSYSDDLSTLGGILASSWNINNSILENLTLNLLLEDSFSNEKYELNVEAFNLSGVAFGDEAFLENMFFSADVLIQDSPSGRFVNFQTESNTINVALTAQGTLENPSASLVVENASFQLGPDNTEFSGSIVLEDFSVTANDVDIAYGNISFKNIDGSVSLRDFNGSLDGFVEGRLSSSSYFAEKTFSSPVLFSIASSDGGEDIPISEKTFAINVVFEEIVSTFLPQLQNYTVELVRTPGRFDLQAGLNGEVTGYLLDTGEISVNATEDFFVQFDAFGIMENSELTMFIDNIFADAQDFSTLVDLPVFSLHSGIAVGSGTLTGPLNDLQINAELFGTNMEISVPDYVNERLICADFPVTVSQNVFSAQNAYFIAQETQTAVNLDVTLSMEQLEFTYLSLDLATLNDEYVLGGYRMPYGTFDGLAQTDLELYITNDLVEVSGNIDTKEVEAIISIVPSNEIIEIGEYDIFVDLVITVEGQSPLYLPSKNNPIIRGLVTQVEPLVIQMDTRYATSLIAGEFSMRGGEILYLSRTFLAREASAVFYDSIESFDPRLTASAEIRERDENGDLVRILLSVENQQLSQLDPIFESIPSMSEQDIMTLLGQIILGSSEEIDPLFLLGGLANYGTQVTVLRGLENEVRDLLNFDTFSFRSMFLQNAIVSTFDNTTNEDLNVGNLLDNTTVYIGKYLNETLYADALLSLVYDEDRLDLGLRGLVFQPEFGLELPSPFATIRWSIAPDLTTDWDLLVPFTSISFSWKYNF